MRRVVRGALVVAYVTACSPAIVQAQASPNSTPEEFLAAAATAAERYADRREAIADGFRRLGPDFPGMGVHWVQTGRIVSGKLMGDRPSVLCYVELDGEQTLVGLAYTLVLSSDESPPTHPFGVDVWHDHSGHVTEESLLLNHPASVTAAGRRSRLSMVHVWTPLTNPAGILEQNNWKLPFLRAGVPPPANPTPEAARGLSLGSRGIEYYRELLHWAAPLEGRDRAVIEASLERRAREVDGWIARHSHAPSLGDLDELEGFWHALWADLQRSLSPETYERIRPLRDGHE